MTQRQSTLNNLAALIEGGGNITIGRIGPIPCAATAGDDDLTYAMLVRRPSETLLQLLARLDTTLAWAWEHEELVDEINAPADAAKRPGCDQVPRPTRGRARRRSPLAGSEMRRHPAAQHLSSR